jgi:hypothetical protein
MTMEEIKHRIVEVKSKKRIVADYLKEPLSYPCPYLPLSHPQFQAHFNTPNPIPFPNPVQSSSQILLVSMVFPDRNPPENPAIRYPILAFRPGPHFLDAKLGDGTGQTTSTWGANRRRYTLTN